MAKLRRNDKHSSAHGDALAQSRDWTIETPRGPARIQLDEAVGAVSLLVLGHGAGGSVDAPDLSAVRAAVLPRGTSVARVTQPYRMAGRRTPPPAAHLDEAWITAVSTLDTPLPLVVGGRSSGARVACRTAGQLGAVGIVALAFPEHPPGRPAQSRGAELRTGLPTVVVNGDRDPFGLPEASDGVEIRIVPGDHSLKRDRAAVSAAVLEWLTAHGWAR